MTIPVVTRSGKKSVTGTSLISVVYTSKSTHWNSWQSTWWNSMVWQYLLAVNAHIIFYCWHEFQATCLQASSDGIHLAELAIPNAETTRPSLESSITDKSDPRPNLSTTNMASPIHESPTHESKFESWTYESETESLKNGTQVALESESRVLVLQVCHLLMLVDSSIQLFVTVTVGYDSLLSPSWTAVLIAHQAPFWLNVAMFLWH